MLSIIINTLLIFGKLIGLIFLLLIVYIIASKSIILVLKKNPKIEDSRFLTLKKIINNLLKYTIGIIAFFGILVVLNIPIQGILAGAGLVGVIVGFGAQELISDMVNGFFVIFEKTYEVGEYVATEKHEGYVVDLGIKSTTIKTYNNEIVIIPNSQMQEVKNFSRFNYITFYSINVEYNEENSKITKLINEEIIKKTQKNKKIFEISYLGLDEFSSSSVKHKMKFETLSEDRFEVYREINKLVKETFEKNNINIPFENITISYKEKNE